VIPHVMISCTAAASADRMILPTFIALLTEMFFIFIFVLFVDELVRVGRNRFLRRSRTVIENQGNWVNWFGSSFFFQFLECSVVVSQPLGLLGPVFSKHKCNLETFKQIYLFMCSCPIWYHAITGGIEVIVINKR
jgi:hypothetical protein